jgi:hypothetical protein
MDGLDASKKGKKISTHIDEALVFFICIYQDSGGRQVVCILEQSESHLIVPFVIWLQMAVASRLTLSLTLDPGP